MTGKKSLKVHKAEESKFIVSDHSTFCRKKTHIKEFYCRYLILLSGPFCFDLKQIKLFIDTYDDNHHIIMNKKRSYR